MALFRTGHGVTSLTRVKDGVRWPIGSVADVAWIDNAIDFSESLVTELPPVFSAYCRLEHPDDSPGAQASHDTALVELLSEESGPRPWWLGYLEYGIDITRAFGDTPRTRLFGWDFVLVQAGAEQALGWRASCAPDPDWKGALPDLLFHVDHSWILFTSWDDRWSGIGGSEDLIERITRNPELGPRTQRLAGPYA